MADVPATAIYCRISDDVAGLGLGVQRQEEDCRQLVERRGGQLLKVYTDNDISAFKGKHRPAYQQLLEDVRSGLVKSIVAWHPDRLHRSPVELEEFIAVVDEAGAAVETVRAGSIDLGTPTGRMIARMLGAAARYESEHKADRIRRKHVELAATGKSAGGGRPFGYNADRRTVRPDEAELIREAARRVLEGEPVGAVCRDWNRREIPTVGSAAGWGPQVMRSMLARARISGRREHGATTTDGRRNLIGRITCDVAEWPAIITVDESDRLRALLGGTVPMKGKVREYLLTAGMARCGRCGGALQSHPKADGRREMACVARPGSDRCGRLGILAEPVEAIVSEAVLQAVDAGALAKAMARDDDPGALQELLAAEGKLAELADDWGADRLTRAEFYAARETILARQDAANKRVQLQRRGQALDGIPDALRAAWPALPLHRRRAILEVLVDQVVIKPATLGGRGGNRFDPDRIEIRWKA